MEASFPLSRNGVWHTVCTMTVEMVWRSGVLFRTGVVMMEAIEITTLHLWGPGYPKLPLPPDVASSLLEDSARVGRREGDPLWAIPMIMAPESCSWARDLCGQGDQRWTSGHRNGWYIPDLKWHRWGCCCSWWMTTSVMEPSEHLEEKHAANPPSWCSNYQCFLHRQDIWWSRSRVPILRWSCELWRTTKHTIVYLGLGPCYEVIALHQMFLLLKKMNSVIMGVSWELEKCNTHFYKNNFFIHIGVHIKCISNYSTYEKLSKK
jgi:hypothetical protein